MFVFPQKIVRNPILTVLPVAKRIFVDLGRHGEFSDSFLPQGVSYGPESQTGLFFFYVPHQEILL